MTILPSHSHATDPGEKVTDYHYSISRPPNEMERRLLWYSCHEQVSEIAHLRKESRPMTFEKRDWRELCKAASKEQDPEKLRHIISELIKVLDERKVPQYAHKIELQK